MNHKDNLYVVGLPSDCRDKHLNRLFADFGEIISASVRMDIRTGRGRGFGFVKFAHEDAAVAALKAMDGKQLLTVIESDETNLITLDELCARDTSGDHCRAPVVQIVSASPISVTFAQSEANYHPAKLIKRVFARNFPSTVSTKRVKEYFETFEGFVSLVYQVSTRDAADAAMSSRIAATTGEATPIVFTSAYVTFDTVENAIKAAQAIHNSVPFPEEQKAAARYMEQVRIEEQRRAKSGTGWLPPPTSADPDPIPILAKVAEAQDARKERLGKKARVNSFLNEKQRSTPPCNPTSDVTSQSFVLRAPAHLNHAPPPPSQNHVVSIPCGQSLQTPAVHQYMITDPIQERQRSIVHFALDPRPPQYMMPVVARQQLPTVPQSAPPSYLLGESCAYLPRHQIFNQPVQYFPTPVHQHQASGLTVLPPAVGGGGWCGFNPALPHQSYSFPSYMQPPPQLCGPIVLYDPLNRVPQQQQDKAFSWMRSPQNATFPTLLFREHALL